MGYVERMQTVAETPTFTKQADKLFRDAEKKDIIDFLANNPEAGDVIAGTGGVRKVRVPASGRGKRGGARVIYYYYDASLPLFALAVYAKNVKSDLSPEGKRIVAQFAAAIKTKMRKST